MTNGSCLKNALAEAGFNLDVPDWIMLEDIPPITEALGLRWVGGGNSVSIAAHQPVIVIYETFSGNGHAEYTENIMSMLIKCKRIIGMITFEGG